MSWHWARVSKLQDTTAEVTSLRQYSPAAAGVAIVTKANAHSAVIGAMLVFKSCFMLLSLCWFLVFAPRDAHGIRGEPALSPTKKSNGISLYHPTRKRNASGVASLQPNLIPMNKLRSRLI